MGFDKRNHLVALGLSPGWVRVGSEARRSREGVPRLLGGMLEVAVHAHHALALGFLEPAEHLPRAPCHARGSDPHHSRPESSNPSSRIDAPWSSPNVLAFLQLNTEKDGSIDMKCRVWAGRHRRREPALARSHNDPDRNAFLQNRDERCISAPLCPFGQTSPRMRGGKRDSFTGPQCNKPTPRVEGEEPRI